MKIVGLGHALPSERYNNDQVIAMFRQANSSRAATKIWPEIQSELQNMLSASGAISRYLSGSNENAFALGLEAANNALKASELNPDDIDVIIYASVSRGWLEPSTASAFTASLGCNNATSFDIIDACASWIRAMQIAQSILDGHKLKRAMVICVEAGMSEFIRLDLANLSNRHRFLASATLGEAAAVTIVEHDAKQPIYFTLKTFAGAQDLCVMPLQNYKRFLPGNGTPDNADTHFQAQSAALVKQTCSHMVSTYRKDTYLKGRKYDIAFSHAVSTRAAEMVGRLIGWPMARYFTTFETHGNTAAATVPLALSLSSKEGALNRGDNCLVAIGSAGITIGFAAFQF